LTTTDTEKKMAAVKLVIAADTKMSQTKLVEFLARVIDKEAAAGIDHLSQVNEHYRGNT
jgi:hypothetical protein